jgi:hypothetical protein
LNATSFSESGKRPELWAEGGACEYPTAVPVCPMKTRRCERRVRKGLIYSERPSVLHGLMGQGRELTAVASGYVRLSGASDRK